MPCCVSIPHGIKQALGVSFTSFRRIHESEIVDLRISIAAIRPLPSFAGTRALRNYASEAFRDTIADDELIRNGNTPTSRSTVFEPSIVMQRRKDQMAGFRRLPTQFPTVSLSRISPTKNYFGACRNAAAKSEGKAWSIHCRSSRC